AKARFRAGVLLSAASFWEEARASFDEALSLFEETGDSIGAALSKTELGMIALEQGDFDAALALATAALDEAHCLDDAATLWYTACLAGNAHQAHGDLLAGRDLHLKAIAHARQTGCEFPVVLARGGLGWNELLCEEYERARETFREQLA